MSFNNTLGDCSVAPENTASDAGVAGAGILLAFIITAALALLLSTYIVLSEFRGNTSVNIPRKILNGLSDQQIVEGIGIQVVGLARYKTMVPYHMFIIWMLALLSTCTTFATLLALVQDFKRDWVLRWLRQFAMFVNLALTVVLGVFILMTNVRGLAPTLPIACVWQEDHAVREDGGGSDTPLSIVGTIAAIVSTCVVFVMGTLYLHLQRIRWGKIVRAVSMVVMIALAIGSAARVLMVSQAFGTPSVELATEGEKQWGFGQLLTMLLLILPFVTALEVFRGETQVPRASPGPDSDQEPLTGGKDVPLDGRYTA
ncbi:hypothetical protein MBLNU230_g7699t1 [Neophaeotheca triangularis]